MIQPLETILLTHLPPGWSLKWARVNRASKSKKVISLNAKAAVNTPVGELINLVKRMSL